MSSTSSNLLLKGHTFFTDQDTSCNAVIAVLRDNGAVVVPLKEAYSNTGVEDEVWLEDCGKKGWIILSRNKRIRYVKSQLAKLTHFSVRVFFIASSKNMRAGDMAEMVSRAIPRIAKCLSGHNGPFVANLLSGGRLKGWIGTCEGKEF